MPVKTKYITGHRLIDGHLEAISIPIAYEPLPDEITQVIEVEEPDTYEVNKLSLDVAILMVAAAGLTYFAPLALPYLPPVLAGLALVLLLTGTKRTK